MHKFYIYILFTITLLTGCRSVAKKNSTGYESVKKGEKMFMDFGCIACHSITGEKKYGPSLNNILDKEVNVIRDGKSRTVKVNRDYILRSIHQPGYEKVDSFSRKTMPVPAISAKDIECIVDYIMYINKPD